MLCQEKTENKVPTSDSWSSKIQEKVKVTCGDVT